MVWVDDGSSAFTFADSVAECVADVQGSQVFNALYASPAAGFTSGVHAYRFTVLAGSGLWVGLTTREKFAKGWACKGLKFGGPGNTSSGGALVTSQFGEPVRAGDVLDMRVDVRGAEVGVTFYQNGRCLGEAFAVPTPKIPLFPFVSAGDKGDKIRAETLPTPPTNTARQEPSFEGVEGPWALLRYTAEPDAAPVQSDLAKLDLRKENGGELAVHLRVANNMNTALKVCKCTPNTWKSVGHMAATMMMPPPHMQVVESAVSKVFSAPKILIEVEANGELKTDGHANGCCWWKRRVITPPVCNDNILQ